MQDTTINNLKLTIEDISKFPNLPIGLTHKDVESLGTISTVGQATMAKGEIYTLSLLKGVMYKSKDSWEDGKQVYFRYRGITQIEIGFSTIEQFKDIVRGLNNLNSCLMDIDEFAKITLAKKLNTNQRPSHIRENDPLAI